MWSEVSFLHSANYIRPAETRRDPTFAERDIESRHEIAINERSHPSLQFHATPHINVAHPSEQSRRSRDLATVIQEVIDSETGSVELEELNDCICR